MSKIFFIEPSQFDIGLTNEICCILYSIIYCINNKKEYIIINSFKTEANTNKSCKISEIINLHHLNILLSKFGVVVFDKEDLTFNILDVKYGLDNNFIDLTSEITNKYYTKNKLLISRGTCLNDIKGDPYPGKEKQLIISYRINDSVITEEYRENIINDIRIDCNNPPPFLLDLSDTINARDTSDLFDYLLKNIRFNSRLTKYSDNLLLIDSNKEYKLLKSLINDNTNKSKKINVIYLRNENYIHLQNKYIELIKTYFSKDDMIFVISDESNKNVIDFLKNNNYDFYLPKKDIFDGTEKQLIVSLLLGEKCNNNFIGNWNNNINKVSAFSYFLFMRSNAIKNIFIDIHNVENDEIVIYEKS